MDELVTQPRRDERELVRGWRLHTLIEAGYPVVIAEKIAAADVDLHLAVDLLKTGCRPDLAAEILL